LSSCKLWRTRIQAAPSRAASFPPQLALVALPLVEVVGGSKTSPDAIQQAIKFYASIGKRPIHLKKELPGHVGNRLQLALYKEVMSFGQKIKTVEKTVSCALLA
jgi:3-hydroxyacyl-CoA dehydrogenase